MFDIYIKDFNQNGNLITTETLVQSIPAGSQNELKLLQPIVKCEMGNAESFNFNIESGTKFYDSFNQMKTFMRVVYDGDTIFYGRVLTIENSFYGNRKIRLEGPLAFLNDTSICGVKEESRPKIETRTYLDNLISNHNSMVNDSRRSFSLGLVPGGYTGVSSEQQIPNDSYKYGQEGWQDTKAAIEDLRSHYGGYLRVRCEGHANSNGTYTDDGHYLDWMNHYFNQNENTQTIEVGKNVIDISTSTEIDNIFTVVIPIGNSKTTSSETVDGTTKSTGPKHFYVDGYEVTVPSICPIYGNALNSGYHTYDDYAQALNRYGRIIKTVTIDDAENKEELLAKCREWIKNNYQGEVTKFTVKAVDMHQIGDKSVSKIMVGDRVKIIYPVGKEDGSVEKKTIVRTCLSISYDLYNPENNAYTFGIPANILTKTYGVTKQGKSTTQASTAPKYSATSGTSQSTDWLDKVTAWLSCHKVNYRHNAQPMNGAAVDSNVVPSKFPYEMDDRYKAHMKGPYGNHRDYLYDIETSIGVGRFLLWKFTPVEEGSDFSQEELNRLLKQVEDSMPGASSTAVEQAKIGTEKAYRDACTYQVFTKEQIQLNGVLSHQNIVECKIIEYVKSEYGIDLTNFKGTRMPNLTYKDSNGNTNVVGPVEGGKVVTKEMFNDDYKSDDPSFHTILTKDGKKLASFVYEDPVTHKKEWQYWVEDPDHPGQFKQTSIRDLEWLATDSATFRGSMIQGDFADPDGTLHIYKFGQEIEKWAAGSGGEMVVAHVDGDVIKIGSRQTRYTSSVAQRINGTWLHPTEYYVDSRGKVNSILIGDAGQGSMEAYWDQTLNKGAGGWRAVPDYYYDFTDAEKREWESLYGPIVTLTGDGFWDTSNLAIGKAVYTMDDPDDPGKKVTYLSADLTVVGSPKKPGEMYSVLQSLVDAGVITAQEGYNPEPQALIAKTIYVEDMKGVSARFKTIETDYLKTTNLKASIANLSSVGITNLYAGTAFVKDINNLDVDLSLGFKGAYISTTGATSTLRILKIDGTFYDPPENFTLTFKNYTGGWDAASNKVIYPKTEQLSSSMIAVTFPLAGDVDGNGLTVTYTMHNDNTDNNWVTLDYYDHDIDEETGKEKGYVSVARFQHNKYNLGWNNASEKVIYPKTEQLSSSMIAVTFPLAGDVDGNGLTKSYTMLNDKSNNNYVTLNYWDEDSNPKGYVVVARFQHNKYNLGWNNASKKVIYPKTEQLSSSMIAFSFPVENSVDGNGLTKSYTMLNDKSNNNYVTLNYWDEDSNPKGYVVVARFQHNKYNAGWGAAVKKVSFPTEEVTSSDAIIVYGPESTIGNSQNRSYILYTYGNDYVDLKTRKPDTTSNEYITVARIKHNKYTTAWGAAYGEVSIPWSGDSTTMTVKWPNSTVGGNQLSRVFTIANDGNDDDTAKVYWNEYNPSGTPTEHVVLKLNHGKFTAGKNSVINAGGHVDQNSNISNLAIYKYVTTLTVNVPTTSVSGWMAPVDSDNMTDELIEKAKHSKIDSYQGTLNYDYPYTIGFKTNGVYTDVQPYYWKTPPDRYNAGYSQGYTDGSASVTPESHSKISIPNSNAGGTNQKWTCIIQTIGSEKQYTLSCLIDKNQSISGLSNNGSYDLYK